MIIRDLTIDDFEQYNNIMFEMHNLHANSRPDIYKAIGKPTDKRAWDFEKSLTTDNMELFGIEDSGNIIGICQMTIRSISENKAVVARKRAYIDQIGVSDNYRRKGIGTLLYNEAIRRATEHKADCLELMVWNFNKTAIEFYKSLGMTVQHSIMEKTL